MTLDCYLFCWPPLGSGHPSTAVSQTERVIGRTCGQWLRPLKGHVRACVDRPEKFTPSGSPRTCGKDAFGSPL
jgi:hypothetical protein